MGGVRRVGKLNIGWVGLEGWMFGWMGIGMGLRGWGGNNLEWGNM